MAAFLHVDLEQVAHIVERRRRLTQMALLLDRSRLRIALDHHETAQHGSIFTRYVLPCRLAEMTAKRNSAVVLLRCQQNAPAIFRHPYIIELRPTLRGHRHRSAQIDERLLEPRRPHVLRTAVSVDPKGWAKFDYVRMPEYRWGILLAPQVAERKIGFGAHKGEAAWQEVPGEYRAMLRRLIVVQGDTEP